MWVVDCDAGPSYGAIDRVGWGIESFRLPKRVDEPEEVMLYGGDVGDGWLDRCGELRVSELKEDVRWFDAASAAADGSRLVPSCIVGDGILSLLLVTLNQPFFECLRAMPPADLGGSWYWFGLGVDDIVVVSMGVSMWSGVGNGCELFLAMRIIGRESSLSFLCSSDILKRSSFIVRRSISSSFIRSSRSLIWCMMRATSSCVACASGALASAA